MAAARARVRGEADTLEGQPQNDAYTGMLLISLLAMIVGCVFLFLDYSQYGDTKAPTPPAVTAPQRTVTTETPTPPAAGTGAAAPAGVPGGQPPAGGTAPTK